MHVSLFSHLSKSLPCFFKEFLSSWGKAVFRSHYSFYIKTNIHVVLFCPCERHERKTIPALFSCKCIFLTSPWTDCSSQLKTLTSSGNYSSIYSLRWERSQESMCWKHTEATQNSEQVAPGFVQMGLGNSKNKNLQPLGILFQCLIILRVTLFFFLYPVGSLSFKSCPSPLFCTSVESSLLGHPFDIYWQGEVAIPEAFSCLDLKKP